MPKLPASVDTARDFPTISPQDWRGIVDRDLRGAPFEKKLVTHTYEGIRIQPLYHANSAGVIPERFAGLPDYTRGADILGLSQCGWEIRQERAEPTPEAVHEAIHEDLLHGVGSVLLRLDVAARQGMDATDARAGRLIGQDGISLYHVDDLKTALEGVHLQMISVALEAGAAFMPAAALLAAHVERSGLDAKVARLAFNADPLAVLARDGQLPQSLDNAYAQMAELAQWTQETFPRSTAVRVGSAPYHYAAATSAQDLGFSIATGIEYLRTLTNAGMSIEAASRQLLFSYAVGCNFFLALSKLRAARQLWSRVIEASGGSADAQRMRMHVRTSRRVLTTRDPWVNLLRNTAGVFAAAVGGADSVTSAPFDQALGLPTKRGRRIARNTATILAEESHLLRVADPAGGSWYLESLTNDLAEKAWVIVQAIESHGGMGACLKRGWVAEQLQAAHEARARNLATRRDALVGVSEFPQVEEAAVEHVEFSAASVISGARKRTFARRSTGSAAEALSQIPRTGSGTNTMPQLVAAAKAGATIGQLASVIFAGDAESIERPVVPHPYAEEFEALRRAADAYTADYGLRPRVFLAEVGSPAETIARSGFATGFFEAGGFEVIRSGQVEVEALTGAFAESAANIAVICSTDTKYEQYVSTLAPQLHAAGARTVVLAGNPGDQESTYRAAGVDRFIFIKCNVLETLRSLLEEEGVLA